MNRRDFVRGASVALAMGPAIGAAGAGEAGWIQAAEALKPQLQRSTVTPAALIRTVADRSQFLQWRAEEVGPASNLKDRVMHGGDAVVLDFGRHLTGYLHFSIAGEGRGIDAPTRLKLIFGEVPAEVSVPFDPYKGGLSRAWLQDETINIDVLPNKIEMPRRYAFRYLKIEVIATSPNFGVRFNDVRAIAVSSAADHNAKLPGTAAESLQRIDAVSVATLRDCMQTVFEDGPKRDRRLWIGDMRLQALTNYATFRNYQLVKRCLYLFAGFPREDGLLAACVFEEPQPHRGHEYILDYAALYGVAVVEYARAANDWATAKELWPVVQKQMELLGGYVGKEEIFAAPPKTWVFIDWSEHLDRVAAMQGVLIYSLGHAAELAEKAGASAKAAEYRAKKQAMTEASRRTFWDVGQGLFVSGPNRQVSLASQAWMVLSGVASRQEGAAALRSAMRMHEAVKPGGPYLYHYAAEAMIHCGMKAEALSLIESYWGGMVRAGADTFWEVYDPANPDLSPYGNVLTNSYCHAWSCTPAYLLRNGQLV